MQETRNSTADRSDSHQTVERAVGLARSRHGVLWSGRAEALKGVSRWSPPAEPEKEPGVERSRGGRGKT